MDEENIVSVTENGSYRARLELDRYPFNPRKDYDHIAHVITPTGQCYIDVDEDGGPLQGAWDTVAHRDDAVEIFTRYARIVHGATVVADRPDKGAWSLWYVMPERVKEISISPEEVIALEIQEYRNWESGEVYACVIEERVTWQRADAEDDESMETWERVDSCCGLNGADYAKSYALEQLKNWG